MTAIRSRENSIAQRVFSRHDVGKSGRQMLLRFADPFSLFQYLPNRVPGQAESLLVRRSEAGKGDFGGGTSEPTAK